MGAVRPHAGALDANIIGPLLILSFAAHMVGAFWFMAVPWNALAFEEPVWTPIEVVHFTPLLLAGLAFAAPVVLAIRSDLEARARPDGLVLLAAAFAAAGMFAGILGLKQVAWAGGFLAEGEARAGVVALYLGFIVSLPLALLGAVRTVRGHGTIGSWILVAYVVVHAAVILGFTTHGLTLPLWLATPDAVEIRLAESEHAQADRPDPSRPRPELVLTADGAVAADGRRLLGALPDENWTQLRTHLARVAEEMRSEYFYADRKLGPLVPDEPLLLSADADAPYARVLDVLREASSQEIGIWKLSLAVRRTRPPWTGTFHVFAPKDVIILERARFPEGTGLVRLEGELLYRSRWGTDEPGPPETLDDVEPGILWRDVVREMDRATALGGKRFVSFMLDPSDG